MRRRTSGSSTRPPRAKKFDPDGTYIRRYVPELADVADEHVHEPWAGPRWCARRISGAARRPRHRAEGGTGPLRHRETGLSRAAVGQAHGTLGGQRRAGFPWIGSGHAGRSRASRRPSDPGAAPHHAVAAGRSHRPRRSRLACRPRSRRPRGARDTGPGSWLPSRRPRGIGTPVATTARKHLPWSGSSRRSIRGRRRARRAAPGRRSPSPPGCRAGIRRRPHRRRASRR